MKRRGKGLFFDIIEIATSIELVCPNCRNRNEVTEVNFVASLTQERDIPPEGWLLSGECPLCGKKSEQCFVSEDFFSLILEAARILAKNNNPVIQDAEETIDRMEIN